MMEWLFGLMPLTCVENPYAVVSNLLDIFEDTAPSHIRLSHE